MKTMQFRRELYSKTALIKAAFNYTDSAYVHLDADDHYYYVTLSAKSGAAEPSDDEFLNEMLAQSVRHEVYLETKDIRKLLLARAMATSVVADSDPSDVGEDAEAFSEDAILRDWFDCHD